MPIKSFRGMISDYDATVPGSGKDTILLSTNNGSVGYKITKLEVMPTDTAKLQQSVLKIYKIPQSTVDDNIDFSDNTLLAAVYFTKNDDTKYPIVLSSFFDNEVFNQDVYITHKDASTGESLNYYIEMEQFKLALDENTVATLKDIRNIKSQ